RPLADDQKLGAWSPLDILIPKPAVVRRAGADGHGCPVGVPFFRADAQMKCPSSSPRRHRNSGRYVAFYLTMSCVPAVDDCEEVCANCGKCGSDIIKLKNCTACRLVKYCGVDCQRAHRKQHKKACKQRAAELKDEQLYSQGHERPERDFCSICTLPIPLPMGDHAVFEARIQLPSTNSGLKHFHGELGLQADTQKGVELLTEAAELGSIQALFNLGAAYDTGEGVQQDEAKAIHFYEKAAMQGHVMSRNNLGISEAKKGNYDRAVRHLLISAKMGHENSIGAIKEMFVTGVATKEQYAEALKGYQNAVEEMKSHDRDEAKRLGY
ncbi:hypothetical protein THAOC_36000, partial [Thalassiosira oceanica]